MSADLLLSKLDKVRARGRGSWTARCPAHDDNGPSLSVKETPDGTTLVHCFAGCGVESVLGAVGLEMADLFPPKPAEPGGGTSRVRRPWSAGDLLALAAVEASVAHIVACDMAVKRDIAPADLARLREAARRLGDMVEACRASR